MSETDPVDDQLMNAKTTCRFFGGIDISSLYRGVKLGRYPAPIKLGTKTSRWRKSECQIALDKLIAAANKQRGAK